MATRTKRTPAAAETILDPSEQWQQPAGTVLQLAQPPDDDDGEPDQPLTAADRVQALLQGAVGDAKAVVKLYKITDKGKYGWCRDYTPEDFEASGMDTIRASWGPGEFVVRLYGTVTNKHGGEGYGVRAHEQLTILEDRSAAGPAALPSGLSETLNAMAATQARLLEALTTRPPAPNPTEQMREMFTLMGLMRTAMGGDAAPRRERGLIEQLADLKALRDMAGELANGEKPEPADPLTAALPGLIELIKGAQVQRAGGVDPAQPPAMPAVSMPSTFTPATMPQENPAVPTVTDPAQALALIQRKLKTIMALAAANVDPEEGASIVYEHLPDELIDMLRADAWFENLCQFAPEAAPHREWLDKARVIALGWIDGGHPDDAEDDDTPDNPDSAA